MAVGPIFRIPEGAYFRVLGTWNIYQHVKSETKTAQCRLIGKKDPLAIFVPRPCDEQTLHYFDKGVIVERIYLRCSEQEPKLHQPLGEN